jgi:hypothetical protein
MSVHDEITVRFLHPRGGQDFEAEIGPQTTGAQALDGLTRAGFIEPADKERAYVLQAQKSQKSLPLSQALVTQGIADGDIVAVTQTDIGAEE